MVYIGDMLIASNNMEDIADLKDLMKMEFDIRDLGNARKVVGIEIIRDLANMIMAITQSRCLKRIIKHFIMENLKMINIHITSHFKLSVTDCPKNEQD